MIVVTTLLEAERYTACQNNIEEGKAECDSSASVQPAKACVAAALLNKFWRYSFG